jgi:hypothetical protein
MGMIVSLDDWRRRPRRPEAERPDAEDGDDVERLERAIETLSSFVSGAVDGGRKLSARVETELLAIMGELAVGMVGDAAGRAERLAERLGRPAWGRG